MLSLRHARFDGTAREGATLGPVGQHLRYGTVRMRMRARARARVRLRARVRVRMRARARDSVHGGMCVDAKPRVRVRVRVGGVFRQKT